MDRWDVDARSDSSSTGSCKDSKDSKDCCWASPCNCQDRSETVKAAAKVVKVACNSAVSLLCLVLMAEVQRHLEQPQLAIL
jgi:hypothetical protein